MDVKGRERRLSDVGANRTALGDGGLDGARFDGALSGVTSTTTGRTVGRRDDMLTVVVVVDIAMSLTKELLIDGEMGESGSRA